MGCSGQSRYSRRVQSSSGDKPARVRISLTAQQTVHIDSPDQKSLKIECGDFADTLKFAASKLVTAGAAE